MLVGLDNIGCACLQWIRYMVRPQNMQSFGNERIQMGQHTVSVTRYKLGLAQPSIVFYLIYSIIFIIFLHKSTTFFYSRDISSTTGKIKRAILQFTPVQWTPVRWLDPTCTYMRFFALSQLVVFWQISELNTFFLKHIFEMPPSHPLVIARLLLVGVIVAPSVR